MITRVARAGCAVNPVVPPVGLSWTDSLIWALDHLRRRPGAAGRADARQAESAPERPGAVGGGRGGAEVYLRAEVLRSLIAIERANAEKRMSPS